MTVRSGPAAPFWRCARAVKERCFENRWVASPAATGVRISAIRRPGEIGRRVRFKIEWTRSVRVRVSRPASFFRVQLSLVERRLREAVVERSNRFSRTKPLVASTIKTPACHAGSNSIEGAMLNRGLAERSKALHWRCSSLPNTQRHEFESHILCHTGL